MIDPRKRKKEREEAGNSAVPEVGEFVSNRCTMEQRAPGAVCGWEHYSSSKKGTPGILVRFVIFSGPDAGRITERTFWKTSAAEGQFADFLLSLGHEEPTDWNNDDHLEAAFSRGAVMLDIRGESYVGSNGEARTKYEPAWFGVYKGKGEKAWNDLMEGAQEGWTAYLKWRESNPRNAPAGDSTKSTPRRSYGGGGSADEDVPF